MSDKQKNPPQFDDGDDRPEVIGHVIRRLPEGHREADGTPVTDDGLLEYGLQVDVDGPMPAPGPAAVAAYVNDEEVWRKGQPWFGTYLHVGDRVLVQFGTGPDEDEDEETEIPEVATVAQLRFPDPFEVMAMMFMAMSRGKVVSAIGIDEDGDAVIETDLPADVCGEHELRRVGDHHVLCVFCATVDHFLPTDAPIDVLTADDAKALSGWAVGQVLMRSAKVECDAVVAQTISDLRAS